VSNIDFLGALGGRIDHMMANIFLLYNTKKMGMKPRIISKKEEIYLAINENLEINGNKDDIISVIAIKGDAKGVTLKNLEYSLNNYNMKYGLPLGISNIMLEDRCFVKVDDGSLLIIKTKHTSH
jgi:thiamine pyrophosphokinase